MSGTLVTRVKTKMFLHTRRRVLHLLDGQYASLLRGRSMDFDDLREYVPGDEVKDIDWKATARTGGAPLVKRYVAERKHRVLFVVDRGRNLVAHTPSGEVKRDLAIMTVGVLGSIALRHGDEVGIVAGDASGVEQTPFRGSERALESVLRVVNGAPSLDGPVSDLEGLLERVRTTVRGRVFLVVVADECEWTPRLESLVRRLAAQHELVWIELPDADPQVQGPDGARAAEVAGGWRMPEVLRDDPRVRDAFEYERRKRAFAMEDAFDRSAVSLARIPTEDDVIPELLRMMKTRSHVHH